MSDFPSLGGYSRSDAFPPLSGSTINLSRSEQFRSIVANSLASQQGSTHSSSQVPSINMDDFPALPGSSPGLANRQGNNPLLSQTAPPSASSTTEGPIPSLASSFNSMAISGASTVSLSALQADAGGRPDGAIPSGRKPTISFNELKAGQPDAGLSSPLAASGTTGAVLGAAVAAAAAEASASTNPADNTATGKRRESTAQSAMSPTPGANRLGGLTSTLGANRPASTETGASGSVTDDQYGLLGLLDTLKTSNPDKSALAFGFDVSKFGLNLSSPGLLYATFTTPWIDQSQANLSHIRPEFSLPACYQVRPRRSAMERLQHFSEETLFYIFYTMPRDELQETAAYELYKRNWRYHKDLKLWLTKDTSAGGENGANGTSPATVKTQHGEQGVYVFFDPSTWQKVYKEFVLVYDVLEDRHAYAGAGGNQASGGTGPASRAGSTAPGNQSTNAMAGLSGLGSASSQLPDLSLGGSGGSLNLGNFGNGGNSSHHRGFVPTSSSAGTGVNSSLAGGLGHHGSQSQPSLGGGLGSQQNFLAQFQQHPSLQQQQQQQQQQQLHSLYGNGGSQSSTSHASLLNAHSMHLSQQMGGNNSGGGLPFGGGSGSGTPLSSAGLSNPGGAHGLFANKSGLGGSFNHLMGSGSNLNDL
ncbi:transcriptional regulator [Tieghemiomyces parasiticus]|uniref:Transcriptional regulator n=1 Tax=Tieghemiomyces parasiticus TaxID=78921 RepID=A0A9W8DTW3_9FUNG|nr:transcriptional regulator [Tieghemiomyces parasiticus]